MAEIAVTGASGVLGTTLCQRLLEDGHRVRGLALEAQPPDLSAVAWTQGSVLDRGTLERVVDGVDAVFHCAGVVGFARALAARQYAVHVGGAELLAQVVGRRCRLVYVSSIGSLGSRTTPEILDEDADIWAGPLQTTYGLTKRLGERVIEAHVSQAGLDAVIVLPAGIWGQRLNRSQTVGLIDPIASGHLPRLMAGGFACVRLADVIDGLLAAWRRGQAGHRYILSEDNLEFAELAQIIARAAGVAAPQRTWSSLEERVMLRVVRFTEKVGASLGKATVSSEQSFRATQLFTFATQARAARELGYAPRPVRDSIASAVAQHLSNRRRPHFGGRAKPTFSE